MAISFRRCRGKGSIGDFCDQGIATEFCNGFYAANGWLRTGRRDVAKPLLFATPRSSRRDRRDGGGASPDGYFATARSSRRDRQAGGGLRRTVTSPTVFVVLSTGKHCII